jgi:hypothetical protein
VLSNDEPVEGLCEFDSHADTCVVGCNFRVIEHGNRVCTVAGFSDAYGKKDNVKIVSAATLVQDEDTGEAYILIVNEALHFPDLPHTLLNPNQIRHAGNDVWDNPYDPNHQLEMTIFDEEREPVTIPIQAQGTILSFPTRVPTRSELATLPHYVLALEAEWNPHTVRLSRVRPDDRHVEEEMTVSQALTKDFMRDVYDDNEISCAFSTERFVDRLISQVIVHTHPADLPNSRGFQSAKRHSSQTPEELSNLWHIGLETAKRTLKVTTNRGVRSAVLPLARRYRTDLFYRKKHLHGKFYTDTVYGRHKSLNGNTCAQIFVNKSLFVVAYHMDSKAKAGEALKQFIQEYGVPEELTFDGGKEQTGKNTEFMRTIRKFSV